MHDLALQNPDGQTYKVQHELSPSAPCRIRTSIAIIDKSKKFEVGLGSLANTQQPLQEPDQSPQIVPGGHNRDQDGVGHQYRIAQHFPILLARVPRGTIDEHDIVRIHRQCGFQKVANVGGLQSENFIGTAGSFPGSSPGESTCLATVGIHNQSAIAPCHESTGQVCGGRGLSTPTFLVCNRYDRCHACTLQPAGC